MRTYKERFEEVRGIAVDALHDHLKGLDWGLKNLSADLINERKGEGIGYVVDIIRLRTLGAVDADDYVFHRWIGNLYDDLYRAYEKDAEGNPEARGAAAHG